MRTAREEIEDLTLTLRQIRYEYYRYSTPVTSDYLYDLLERLLVLLEKENPEYRLDVSPTLTVGSDMLDKELEALRPEFLKTWKEGHKYQMPDIK